MRRGISLTDCFARVAVAGVIVASSMGCSTTSYLAQGEKLYTGADVIIDEKMDVPDKADLKERLEKLVKPEPNGKLLGLFRLKLWLYNMGIFKESLGEPPVLLHLVAPDRIAARMRTLLDNTGYYGAEVQYTVREEQRTGDIEYHIAVYSPYRIKGISVQISNGPLADAIGSTMGETLLIPGDQYDLEILQQERERITAALKEKGYFSFSPDFIVFQADSTVGNRTVNLFLQIKRDIPPGAARVFTIGDIYITSGYSLNRDSVSPPAADTLTVNGCHYIDLDRKFEPDVVVRSTFFRKGTLYSRNIHELTLSRLMDLGVFKFVNITFVETDPAGIPHLDPHISLTPLSTKNIRFELQGVSKSNNLVGPVFNSSFRNRNMFGGAELFLLGIEIGFETPLAGGPSAGESYEIGLRGELDLPEFVTPFAFSNISSFFVPRTRIVLGTRLLHRLQYYQLSSADASFGYTWKESLSKEHAASPLSITFAHLTQTTQKFDDLLSKHPLLRKSFEEQFVIGQNYSFTYNDQLEKNRKNHLYFRGTIDLSGNVLNFVQSLFSKNKATPETPYRIFGTIYSQYYKCDIDLRHYFNNAGQSTSIASRLIAGMGVAYGNSATLPYVKQFSIGGSNSVRAFAAQALGPGSFKSPDSVPANSFTVQAGDIKLEANIEYRFPIVSILKGALFLDAGNIWLLRNDPARPGGAFSRTTFLDEIAVGTGIGLRVDLSFFIIRCDVAFPLRVPARPRNDRWVISKVDFGDPAWRWNNIAWNIAIGYPY